MKSSNSTPMTPSEGDPKRRSTKTTQSRTDNAITLLLLPARLACLVLCMAYMLAIAPIMLLLIFLVLAPAELLWILSPFVGLISPALGHWMAESMEGAADAFGNIMDIFMEPMGRLMDFAF